MFVVFAVELVELLGSKVNNTIHHPSAPGVDVEASCNVIQGKYFGFTWFF